MDLPSGFDVLVQASTFDPLTTTLIQQLYTLHMSSSTVQPTSGHSSYSSTRLALAKETNYLSISLLLKHRTLPPVENILVLALTSYAHYIITHLPLDNTDPSAHNCCRNFSPVGLGISNLLSRISSMLLARDASLADILPLHRPEIRLTMIWASCMLIATSISSEELGRILGMRILRLCRVAGMDDGEDQWDGEVIQRLCREKFIWLSTLPMPEVWS